MKRIHEIIACIRSRHPEDNFFSNFENSCKDEPIKRKHYCAYNKALMTLDDTSWHVIKKKALRHYLNHRYGQTKQGFFNQLNEAFAYRYLVGKGFENVRVIEEGRKKRPDISFTWHGKQYYCEVKSLGISEAEIEKREALQCDDGAIYVSLSDGFLGKFAKCIKQAREQIHEVGGEGFVFVVIEFDDFSLEYYKNYMKQLIEFSKKEDFGNFFIKIGLLGNRKICNIRL